MDELENKLSSLLSSPEAMQQIRDMAQKLMPPTSAEDNSSAPTPVGGETQATDNFDLAALAPMLEMLKKSTPESDGKQAALLSALQPFLSEKRRSKLKRAMDMMRMAKIAKFAMANYKGGE